MDFNLHHVGVDLPRLPRIALPRTEHLHRAVHRHGRHGGRYGGGGPPTTSRPSRRPHAGVAPTGGPRVGGPASRARPPTPPPLAKPGAHNTASPPQQPGVSSVASGAAQCLPPTPPPRPHNLRNGTNPPLHFRDGTRETAGEVRTRGRACLRQKPPWTAHHHSCQRQAGRRRVRVSPPKHAHHHAAAVPVAPVPLSRHPPNPPPNPRGRRPQARPSGECGSGPRVARPRALNADGWGACPGSVRASAGPSRRAGGVAKRGDGGEGCWWCGWEQGRRRRRWPARGARTAGGE